MSKTSKTIRKMCALAGICVLAASANALPVDARIMIDRALNSPTLTVRYDGANAALVELRVNGESIGTRSVTAGKTSGETNFNINLSELKDGDNEVEVRLYDRTGKLVGSDKSNISTDQTNYGPVFLKTPKVGATVMGDVEIDMGFGRELKNVYVSFFVDSNFKRMTNYPPYTMTWNTIGETNGWHEVEAWAIDETSTTYKTRKTRVFINNPGGSTDRTGVQTDLTTIRPGYKAKVGEQSGGLRPMEVEGTTQAVGAQSNHLAPKGTGATLVSNDIHARTVGAMSGSKAASLTGPLATGTRLLMPTGTRVAVVSSPQFKPVATGEIIIHRHSETSGQLSQVVVGQGGSEALAPRENLAPVHESTAVHPSRVDKRTELVGSVAMAPRHDVTVSQVAKSFRQVSQATNLVRITKGQRLPNLTSFEVILNSSIVEFPDVQPRVDDGVPMTPFRYLLEKAGGTVDWANLTKTVSAKADGREIVLQIGDRSAMVNKLSVSLEVAPYIDRGRTVVPMSFIHDALNVNVDYDKETGHVLISKVQN